MEDSQHFYDELVQILKAKYINRGMKNLDAEKKAIEDSRYVFPNACETKIMLTMNARSLINFFQHRCCNRAQWEIHSLADRMLKEVRKIAPLLFKNIGPVCLSGKCPEGSMTCGSMNEVKEKHIKL